MDYTNSKWGACGTCLGTQYVDANGNSTGDGNTYVAADGLAGPCSVSGWMIAAVIGVFLLVSTSGKKK